jgi:hypothetical protein
MEAIPPLDGFDGPREGELAARTIGAVIRQKYGPALRVARYICFMAEGRVAEWEAWQQTLRGFANSMFQHSYIALGEELGLEAANVKIGASANRSHRRTAGRIFGALILVAATVAACGGAGSRSADPGRDTYRSRVCSAIVGLADNATDFKTIRSAQDVATGLAALERVIDRSTQASTDLRSAGAAWEPGRVIATELATSMAGLASMSLDLKTGLTGGDVSSWTTFTARYAAWYADTSAVASKDESALTALGVSCPAP